VSADVLDRPPRRPQRELSPRERRRLALEAALENAISSAKVDPSAAFRVDLEQGEKVPAVRLAFNRVRERLAAGGVNLLSRDSVLFIANRPQTRGRRART